jgi:hypothetical protein
MKKSTYLPIYIETMNEVRPRLQNSEDDISQDFLLIKINLRSA